MQLFNSRYSWAMCIFHDKSQYFTVPLMMFFSVCQRIIKSRLKISPLVCGNDFRLCAIFVVFLKWTSELSFHLYSTKCIASHYTILGLMKFLFQASAFSLFQAYIFRIQPLLR